MSKHFRIPKKLTAKKLYWVLILVIVMFLGLLSMNIVHQYSSSLHWKESPDSKVAMANQSIDMLYDKSATSRANKIKFTSLYNKIIEKNGGLSKKYATPENISRIKYYYNNFDDKGSQTNYKKQYAEILLKYSIQEQFDNLFTDDNHSTLESNVTPKTIIKLNNNTFSDLTSLFVQNPNDAFVKDTIALETKLNQDIITLDKVATSFNSAYVFKGHSVTLRKGYTKDITTIYRSEISELKYDWDSTNYMQGIVTMMKPIVDWTIKQYNLYSDYTNDMLAKSKAYSSWNADKQQFLDKVKSTHQAAVDAKHYQEEVAREQAKAAKEAKEQKEYNSGLTAGTNDGEAGNDKADLSGKSSKYVDGYNAGYAQGQANSESKAKADSESKEQASKNSESKESSEKEQSSRDKQSNDDSNNNSSSSSSSSSSSNKNSNSSNSSQNTQSSSSEKSSETK